jgi:carbonic anhydrase
MTEAAQDPNSLAHLFANNREWAGAIVAKNPDFFQKLSAQQTPEFLWIGCSDSRVPANQLLGLLPGDVFVHRNVANVIVHSDLNFLSVLQFAIQVMKVRHIIVCGHYGCSGVQAALLNRRIGLADNWLRHVQDVHQKYNRYLGEVLPLRARHDRLCELNAIEQAANVSQTTIVQDAWDQGQPLTIHSWVYGIEDGLLRDLDLTLSGPEDLACKLPVSLTRYEAA